MASTCTDKGSTCTVKIGGLQVHIFKVHVCVTCNTVYQLVSFLPFLVDFVSEFIHMYAIISLSHLRHYFYNYTCMYQFQQNMSLLAGHISPVAFHLRVHIHDAGIINKIINYLFNTTAAAALTTEHRPHGGSNPRPVVFQLRVHPSFLCYFPKQGIEN